MTKFFFDTNIFLYALSTDKDESAKQKIALDLILNGDYAFSTVVLGEFYTVVTRKANYKISHDIAMEWINGFLNCPCVSVDKNMAIKAMSVKNHHNLQYFDSTHIVAAQKLGVNTIYSEDYKHNEIYDGVRVINPFLTPTT